LVVKFNERRKILNGDIFLPFYLVGFTYHEYEMHVGTGVTAGQDESRVAGLGMLPLLIQYLNTSNESAAGNFLKSSVI
jgi:hypothetical protein